MLWRMMHNVSDDVDITLIRHQSVFQLPRGLPLSFTSFLFSAHARQAGSGRCQQAVIRSCWIVMIKQLLALRRPTWLVDKLTICLSRTPSLLQFSTKTCILMYRIRSQTKMSSDMVMAWSVLVLCMPWRLNILRCKHYIWYADTYRSRSIITYHFALRFSFFLSVQFHYFV